MLWNWGFVGFGAGATTVNLIWGATSSYDVRVSRYFSAGNSGALFLLALINPLRVDVDVPADAQSPCSEVRHRERVLAALAKDEAKRRSALYHIVPLTAGIATGITLGLAFDQWRNGVLNAALAVFVTELRILTAPNGARTALRRYRHGDIGGDGAKAAWSIAPTVVGQNGTGLSFSVVY